MPRGRGVRRSDSLAAPVDVFRTPDERFEGLPGYDFEPHYAEVDGLRLHYLDEGDGRSGRLLSRRADLVVPVPEDDPAARRGRQPRDLPRLRRVSAAPTSRPTATGTRYDRHVELMTRLLEQLDVRDATVVVQDWGGPIGLRWAVENPDRVARLVILNTGLFAGQVNEAFMAWRNFAERNPDLPVGVRDPGRDRDRRSRRRSSTPTRRRGRTPSRRPASRSSRCSCRSRPTRPGWRR